MAQSPREGNDRLTVKRLLEAAAKEFARHGYAATRVRDIVEAAGANLAAVNYHYGGKEGLYRATIAHLARRAREDLPGESPELRARPPEERLHALVLVMLRRHLGPEQSSAASRLVAHELLDPTPAFDETLREISAPPCHRLEEIVALLLGPRADAQEVSLACLSVAGQWESLPFARRALESRFAAIAAGPDLVDRVARHIVAFSVAALGARRAQLESPDPRKLAGATVASA
ncbi:MAG: CerR family C-terminal domain-containing protein [Burkholderiales bacterium]